MNISYYTVFSADMNYRFMTIQSNPNMVDFIMQWLYMAILFGSETCFRLVILSTQRANFLGYLRSNKKDKIVLQKPVIPNQYKMTIYMGFSLQRS